MSFPISFGRASLFQILGVWDGMFHFYLNSNRTFCEQREETLIRHSATSDLGLCYLPLSHKQVARLIWVK